MLKPNISVNTFISGTARLNTAKMVEACLIRQRADAVEPRLFWKQEIGNLFSTASGSTALSTSKSPVDFETNLN